MPTSNQESEIKAAPIYACLYRGEAIVLYLSAPNVPHGGCNTLQWQMYTARVPYEGTKPDKVLQGIMCNAVHLKWPPGE
jgi:hypothetical protein